MNRCAYILIFLLLVSSCEKEITIDIPEAEPKVVVEGRIENGAPPYLFLTKSIGYFEPTSIEAFESGQVHDAVVTVTVDGVNYPLEEICSQNIPDNFKPLVAEFIGISVEELSIINYCAYTVPIANLIIGNYLKGEPGKVYHLKIEAEGKVYTSKTKIPELVPLDKTWFQTEGNDTLGFVWGHLTDPDTLGNAYRWFAKRISHFPNIPEVFGELAGQQKDQDFLPPIGSAFNDNFINGKSFDFGYQKGEAPNPTHEPWEDHFLFKSTDTVVVKFTTIDHDHYEFLRIFEVEAFNNGNPFASPTTIPTNIEGGALGIWGGYGASYDTVTAVK